VSVPLTVEQQFLVSPGETFVSELEKVVDVIAGKPEDPGFLQPASKRVAMVIADLERTIAAQRLTLESIGRAEGV
jgi:hypothetical protein